MKWSFKPILAAATIILLFNSNIFAIGAGIQAGAVPGMLINESNVKFENFTCNITGTVRLSRFPIVAGTGFEFGKFFSDFDFGFSAFADYWAIDCQLKNTWNLFSGFGLSCKFLTNDFRNWNLETGPRFFAGINRLFYDGYLEFYAQQNIVPTYIKNISNSETKAAFMLYLPFETGLRMHF